jgi:hypothetical protein
MPEFVEKLLTNLEAPDNTLTRKVGFFAKINQDITWDVSGSRSCSFSSRKNNAVSTGEDADETGIVARFLKFGKPSRSFNCYARTAKAKRAA